MKKSEKISEINNRLSVAIAEEKTKLAKAELEYRERVTVLMSQAQIKREEAIDDPDEPQEGDQPTVWLNGEQWSCAVVARRILNKLPKLNSPKESFYIEISPSYFGGCGLSFRYINTIDKASGVTSCELLAKDEPEEQAKKVDLWMKEVEVQMAKAQEIMREEADNE
jgi:hypothetical protein